MLTQVEFRKPDAVLVGVIKGVIETDQVPIRQADAWFVIKSCLGRRSRWVRGISRSVLADYPCVARRGTGICRAVPSGFHLGGEPDGLRKRVYALRPPPPPLIPSTRIRGRKWMVLVWPMSSFFARGLQGLDRQARMCLCQKRKSSPCTR